MIGYLIRDLDDCGLQIFLLFFLTSAMSNLAAGNHARVGFWLATATTYKATPIIFLPYLVWKRQWRAAAWMAVFIGAWACAPMPFVGVEKTVQCHQQWLAHIQRVAEHRKAYPDQLIEPQRTDNLSLMALFARCVETYPPGHLLYVDHPLFLQPGNLAPEQAYVAVQGMLLSLGALLAWRFRRSFQSSAATTGLTAEWAAVSLLVAIVSPLCWKQHLVLGLPALFLIVRATLAMAPDSATGASSAAIRSRRSFQPERQLFDRQGALSGSPMPPKGWLRWHSRPCWPLVADAPRTRAGLPAACSSRFLRVAESQASMKAA